MRVLVIGRCLPDARNPFFGIFELQQARALANAGHDIVFGFVDGRGIHRVRSFKPVSQADSASSVEIRGQRLPVKGLPWPIVRSLRTAALRRVVDDAVAVLGGIDVVYAHFPAMTLTAPFIDHLRRDGIPLVALEHWSRVADGTIPRKRRPAAAATAAYAYRYCAVTPSLAESIEKQFSGELANPVDVIPNIVEPPQGMRDRPMPAADDAAHADFRLVAIGRLISDKRFDIVLKSIALLPDDVRGMTKLTIIGGGEEQRTLERLARQLSIEDAVEFAGRLDNADVWPVLYESDAYVTASPLETFGVPVAEAWSAGVHCVAPDNNPLRPHFTDENGTLFRVNDANSLAVALADAHRKQPTLSRERISVLARERYASTSVVARITGIFEDAIAAK